VDELLLETAEDRYPDMGWQVAESHDEDLYVYSADDDRTERWDLDEALSVALEVGSCLAEQLGREQPAHVAVETSAGDWVMVDVTVSVNDGRTLPFERAERDGD
jgi:hypothetical protein